MQVNEYIKIQSICLFKSNQSHAIPCNDIICFWINFEIFYYWFLKVVLMHSVCLWIRSNKSNLFQEKNLSWSGKNPFKL